MSSREVTITWDSDAEEYSELDSDGDMSKFKPIQVPTCRVPLLRPRHKRQPFKKVHIIASSHTTYYNCFLVVVVLQVKPKKNHVSQCSCF